MRGPLSCFFIARRARGQGVMTKLIDDATSWGHDHDTVIEGYPIDTAVHGATPRTFPGILQTFLDAGSQRAGTVGTRPRPRGQWTKSALNSIRSVSAEKVALCSAVGDGVAALAVDRRGLRRTRAARRGGELAQNRGMDRLADSVLPLIRTRADLRRWSAANAHGRSDVRRRRSPRGGDPHDWPRRVSAATHKALARRSPSLPEPATPAESSGMLVVACSILHRTRRCRCSARPPGRLAGWPAGRLAGWPAGRLAGWPARGSPSDE